MEDAPHERSDAGDRAAHEGIAAARQLAGVREPLRERHADPGADRRGDARDEGVERLVRMERDREDRRQRRERAVDKPGHRRLDALEEEGLLVGHGYSVSNKTQTGLS